MKKFECPDEYSILGFDDLILKSRTITVMMSKFGTGLSGFEKDIGN